jgi:acyl carrier protein
MEPGTLRPENRIDDLTEWDSLAILNTIVLMDRECGLKVTGAQIAECRTLADILNLASGHLSA